MAMVSDTAKAVSDTASVLDFKGESGVRHRCAVSDTIPA